MLNQINKFFFGTEEVRILDIVLFYGSMVFGVTIALTVLVF